MRARRMADVMPGTISNAMPVAPQFGRLFATPSEDEHIAALEPDDAPAVFSPSRTMSAVISSCVSVWLPAFFSDVDAFALR